MYMQGIGRLRREEVRTRVRIMAKCQHSQICNNVPTETLMYILLQEHNLVRHWRLSSGEWFYTLGWMVKMNGEYDGNALYGEFSSTLGRIFFCRIAA